MTVLTCTPKRLPFHLWVGAAETAVRHNPANRPARCGLVLPPTHLAMLTAKYWGARGVDLSVSFLDNPPPELRAKLLSHMNAWSKSANVRLRETSGTGQVRVARTPGEGYWSYLGPDILHIPANEPTMMLDSFTMQTPDSEFFRVVRHETGHTLGFPHEHLRRELVSLLDPQKTVAYFQQHYGWSAAETQEQVLTPLEDASLQGTPHADPLSIMCYQLPGDCTRSGQAIPGGTDIDPADFDFAATVYPKPDQPPPPPPPAGSVTLPATGTHTFQKQTDGRWKLIFGDASPHLDGGVS